MKKSLLSLCLFIFLSGCTKTVTITELPTLPEFPKPEMVPFDESTGRIVIQPDTNPTWFFNTLTIKYENRDVVSEDGLTTTHQYLVVDGLLNNAVESKINDTIFAMSEAFSQYTDFKLAPSYRGLLKQFPSNDTRVDAIDISTYENFNFNNLLSVITSVCVITNQPSMDKSGCSYRVMKSLTFDLNTGKPINLSDLFVTGSDYVSRLNELVMLDIQGSAQLESEVDYDVDYDYLGGFTGIRGDVDFCLTSESLILTFDQNHPEFFNEFTPTAIAIPYEKLKDILAIDQRFAVDKSLFKIPPESKFNNYLYENPTQIVVEKRDQTLVRMIINESGLLSETHKAIADRMIATDKKQIDLAVKNKVNEIWYKIVVTPVGPYMNVDRILYLGSEDDVYLRVTYKPDGTPLTFSDVFRAGFDYKALIIAKMKAIATENQFPDEYDYEAIFKTMKVMIFQNREESPRIRVFNKFQLPPAIDYGTFDVSLSIEDYPNDILIKTWAD